MEASILVLGDHLLTMITIDRGRRTMTYREPS